jgi:hypothetical protein
MDWTDSFKWAEPRHDTYPDCGLKTSFQIVCEIARMNSEQADAHNDRPRTSRFRTADLGTSFMVFRSRPLNGGDDLTTVYFELQPGQIIVSRREDLAAPRITLFSAMSVPPEGGRCLLSVTSDAKGTEPLTLGETVRKALLDLFRG